jgi:FkbM family methyltransferase
MGPARCAWRIAEWLPPLLLAMTFAAVLTGAAPRWVIVCAIVPAAVTIPYFLPPPAGAPRWSSLLCISATIVAVAAALVGVTLPATSALRAGGTGVPASLVAVAGGALWAALYVVFRISAGRQRRVQWNRGLVRSFLIYYGVPFRFFRMKRFYQRFVQPGTLVFDVGAHVGSRVRVFRALGARVVAIEPQDQCATLLERSFVFDSFVTVVRAACGSEAGTATLRIDRTNPTVATLSDEWIHAFDAHHAKHGIRWDGEKPVAVRTLDEIILEHGAPAFVKIDVEGFEAETLRGLSRPIPCVSFEFLPAARATAMESVAALERLGPYRYRYSLGETMWLAGEQWLSAAEMREVLEQMPVDGASGDVYAVLATDA